MHETLIKGQKEMCCPEPISSEMAQLLTSQLSKTLANTFYVVKEMCGILESLFLFYLLQNCHL